MFPHVQRCLHRQICSAIFSKFSRFAHVSVSTVASVATESSKLPYWLPVELKAQFLAYKKHVFSDYERLTNVITDNQNTAGMRSSASRWEELRPVVDVFEELDLLLTTDVEVERLVADILNNGQEDDNDNDLVELASVEKQQRLMHRHSLEKKLLNLVVPTNPTFLLAGTHVELVAGAGGREAGLFARELLEMYRYLAIHRGWEFRVIQETTMSGDELTLSGSESPLSKARIAITGNYTEPQSSPDEATSLGVYGQLFWEAGVHRVQRVPVTSRQGKIHTSTVAVSVLPLSDEITVDLPDKDLKWEFYRASGAGGQHVNRTCSAVRLTHLPTDIVVTCQQERCQQTNKKLALQSLKEKLQTIQQRSISESEDCLRRSHIGHLERLEKIRTYNFPQDRVTDHRVAYSWTGVERFMRHTTGLSEAIQALFTREQRSQLKRVLSEYECTDC